MAPAAEALVYTAPGVSRIEAVDPGEGEVLVRARFGALSRGTERLVFEGRVPEAEWPRMRAPFQSGDFPFPVRYGYATVGTVEDGPEALRGRDVFCLHPHQTLFRVPTGAALPLPPDVPAARAVLAANMETALNALWDATLPPGARCLVVGAGLLGWLIASLLSARADLEVHVTDIRPETGVKADDFGVNFVTPGEVPRGAFDIAFHTSASGAGLATALDALVFEGTVIELSWYGDRAPEVPLGGAFHSQRLTIRSSQVGHVAPSRRARMTHRDRLAAALAALADPRLDALITETVAFRDLPAALPRLLGPGAAGIATRIAYDQPET